ncbi:hypothetical protein MMC24_002859 [Lignoscripta atroalba]|nr:hypothetical protein [Lignoscripta atroalba]
MEFVSKNTAVPVPRIITAFQVKGGTCYILRTRCPGVPLCNVFGTLSMKERTNVLLQLRGFMDELRALKPPNPGQVGSTDYAPLHDDRIHNAPCGPFESVAQFHTFIRGGVEYPTGHEESDMMIRAQNCGSYSIKFTHGDLSFRNILYMNGKITGILDWESAGWFPDYWEYAMAWDSFWDNPDLRGDIDTFLEPFPGEFKMEQTRRRLFRGM